MMFHGALILALLEPEKIHKVIFIAQLVHLFNYLFIDPNILLSICKWFILSLFNVYSHFYSHSFSYLSIHLSNYAFIHFFYPFIYYIW